MKFTSNPYNLQEYFYIDGHIISSGEILYEGNHFFNKYKTTLLCLFKPGKPYQLFLWEQLPMEMYMLGVITMMLLFYPVWKKYNNDFSSLSQLYVLKE